LTPARPTPGRHRRSRALWLAGRDAAVPAPARWLARAVSAYERAPLRDLISAEPIALAEEAVAALAVRATLRIAGGRPPHPEGAAPSPSGWPGNGLVLAAWALPMIAVAVAARW